MVIDSGVWPGGGAAAPGPFTGVGIGIGPGYAPPIGDVGATGIIGVVGGGWNCGPAGRESTSPPAGGSIAGGIPAAGEAG